MTEGEVLEQGIEAVLQHLKETRAFDFTGYKRATLTRRIEKRMQVLGLEDPVDYVDYLQVHPDEFEPLFNTILINVTSFFRDPEAWDAMRDVMAPVLGDHAHSPIRIWSAGCASGQEAYSAVMLVAEQIGVGQTKERLKVYATDIDQDALEQARTAHYSSRELETVPSGLVDKYFEATPHGATFSSDLRRTVIFGRHDLLQDAPISRVDLLLCRNTLMYFNTDVQAQLIGRLHFSLADRGVLMLGKVETLLGQGELFNTVDTKQRLFRKIPRSTLRSRLLAITPGLVDPTVISDGARLLDVSFEHGADPAVILDSAGNLVAVNLQARTLFGIPQEVVGRPFQDLELSYRPVELRSSIDRARAEGRPVKLTNVERYSSNGELRFLEIDVVPLIADGRHLGVVIRFTDVTRHRELQDELEHTHRELETAYEELQSSNEELETTNEELQSTVEELETTNEELQSTNEELETMNEELSSSNEELQAINDELRDRTSELGRVSSYMESILTSLRASVIVVDRDLQVRLWNGQSFAMWGLRADEVEGHNLLGLDIGLPVDELSGPIRACLVGDCPDGDLFVDALTRRGHQMQCRVQIAPLTGANDGTEGAIVLVEEAVSAH